MRHAALLACLFFAASAVARPTSPARHFDLAHIDRVKPKPDAAADDRSQRLAPVSYEEEDPPQGIRFKWKLTKVRLRVPL